MALGVSLGQLADVPLRRAVPSEDAQKIFALVSGRLPAAKVRRALEVVRTMLDGGR